MSFDKYVYSCSHHYDQDIYYSIIPKVSIMPLFS